MGKPKNPFTVILDTNLWSYIGRFGVSSDFDALEERHNLHVVTPPLLLLEVMRTGDPDVRDSVVAALTSRQRARPLPEVNRFCLEFVDVVRRRRPEWIRRVPNTAQIPPLENFWTKRVWQQARFHPTSLSARLGDQSTAEKVTSIQKENQSAFRESGATTGLLGMRVDLRSGSDEAVVVGWDGDDVPFWRLDLAMLFWHNLVRVRRKQAIDQTWVDWAGPWIDLRRMEAERGSFNRLWYEEIPISEVPASWIVWAIMTKQLGAKVNLGNATDSSLGAYLIDVDGFLTADRRFVLTLSSLYGESPIAMARSELVSLAPDGIIAGLEMAIVRLRS